jgi:hypothetical protein
LYLFSSPTRLGEWKSGTASKKRRNALEQGDLEYPGNLERIIAKRVFPSRRLATKGVYNLGPEDQ